MKLEFSTEIYSLAEHPHVEKTAKVVGVPKEKLAFLEFSKAALMTSMFAATEKQHHNMLLYKLAGEDGKAVEDILRIIAVSIKNIGEITPKDFEMIYDILGAFEAVPTFNRNKCMYMFVYLLGKKGFRVPETTIETMIPREELKEVIREVIREELPTLLRAAEKLSPYVR